MRACHSAHVEVSGQRMRVILSPSVIWVPGIQLRVRSLGSKSVQLTEPSPQPTVSFTSRSLVANISLCDEQFQEGTDVAYLMKEPKYLIDCIWILLIYLEKP